MPNLRLDLNKALMGKSPVITCIGMAKNAGKTVAMNYIHKQIVEQGYVLGLTSIGRDGEKTDAVTKMPKPSITVNKGALVASAINLLDDTKFEFLTVTNICTPLGNVAIARALTNTGIVLAGPRTNRDLKEISDRLFQCGAQCVLVDGAFDRQSSADPLVSSNVILATGATLSSNLEQLIEMTVCRVQQLTLERCAEAYAFFLENTNARILGVSEGGDTEELFLPTTLLHKQTWQDILSRNYEALLIKGAAGDELAEALLAQQKPPVVVVRDGSKIFIKPSLWKQLRIRGIKFQTIHAINVIAVTINPTVPNGKGLCSREMLFEMSRALRPLPVYDIMREMVTGQLYEGENALV